MRGKIILLLAILAVLPIISVVSASVDTTITVFSGVGQTISLNIINPSNGDLISALNETNTDNAGKASFSYTSGSRTAINFSVIARGSSGNIIKMKKFGGYFAGDLIALDMTGGTTTPAATTTTNTTNTTSTAPVVNTTNTTNTTITALATTTTTTNTTASSGPGIVEKSKEFIVKWWIWIVGVIVVLVVIYVLIKIMPVIKHKIDSMPKAPTSSSINDRPKSKIEAQLLEAEKKIKQAQAEINELRNKDNKVKEAERKFEEAKRELEKAKRF
jgi:flagellar biosynthesis/type III secretory pathway M-ring protein FliF/YscJ